LLLGNVIYLLGISLISFALADRVLHSANAYSPTNK
jgi:hypothetical protein